MQSWLFESTSSVLMDAIASFALTTGQRYL